MKTHTHVARLVLAVAAAACGTALANPSGPQIVNGQVGFGGSGSQMLITNTPGAIINWQSFSIGQGELTRFIQQSAASSVLNRIIGQDPTKILGALQSNGRVFLLNPNGILFGPGAQVDVNGLVASSLSLTNVDFLAGKLNFAALGKAGDVVNQGTITTPGGGQVYLIAPNVNNSGIITSPGGDVMLAAGQSVNLADSMDPAMRVVISAPGNHAVNIGNVVAESGRIGIYGALIDQLGLVSANSVVAGEGGRIIFKAAGDTILGAGSRTTAVGAGKGGEIQVLGNRVGLAGDAVVDASGQTGGGTVLVGGDYHGDNPAVQNAARTFVGADTQIRADALQSGDGGKVVLWSDEVTRGYGRISARGGPNAGNGGFVETSSKMSLDFRGTVDAGAPKGKGGTWLLDPDTITLIGGTGDGSTDGTATFLGSSDIAGTINFADLGLSVVYQSELQGLFPGTNVVLEANKSIGMDATKSFGNQLLLPLNSNLTLRTRNSANDAGGTQGIDLTGSLDGTNLIVRTQGTGTITLQTGVGTTPLAADIKLAGLTTGGGAIQVAGTGSIALGQALNAGTGFVILNAATSIDQTGGAILASSLQASAGNGIGNGTALVTQVGELLASSGGASTDINVTNTGTLTILGASQTAPGSTGKITISNTGAMTVAAESNVSTQLGNISLVAHSPLTVNGTVSSASGGAIALEAGASGSTNDNLTISATGVVATTGSVTLKAGNTITVSGTVPAGATLLPQQNLPSLAQCIATPGLAGCSVVLPSLANCIASPAGAGCSVVLPSLASCTASPATAGCSVVLPSLAACTTTPAAAGCSVVLPTLAICSVTPSAAGCSVVLPTLAQCTAFPALAGCSIVLPTLATCTVTPAAVGCNVVLPSIAACIATPTAAGCSVVLPALAACITTPSVAGCSAILPSIAVCAATPSLAGCTAVLPPVASSTPANQPLVQAINTTVSLVNTSTTTLVAKADKDQDLKKEDTKDATTVAQSPAAGGKVDSSKKMYCN